jgi:hypothetical protein
MQDNNQSHRHIPPGEQPQARRTGTGEEPPYRHPFRPSHWPLRKLLLRMLLTPLLLLLPILASPFIAQAAVKAAEAAAVAAASHRASIEFSFAPLGDVLEPVSSTFPAGAAAFSANIMPTAVLAPTAKFAPPDAWLLMCPFPQRQHIPR